MTCCHLIICEKAPRFAPAVRRELRSDGPRLTEVRSLTACETALPKTPESVVAIEVTVANLEFAATFIMSLSRRYPRSTAIALLTAETLVAEPLLVEAGAIAVFRSLLDAPALARIAARKLRDATPADLSLSELIAQRLPWPAHATTN